LLKVFGKVKTILRETSKKDCEIFTWSTLNTVQAALPANFKPQYLTKNESKIPRSTESHVAMPSPCYQKEKKLKLRNLSFSGICQKMTLRNFKNPSRG